MKRIAKWDNMKCILIFTVVLGHMCSRFTKDYIDMQRIYFYVYMFHMPAFLFVSGLFAKKTIRERRYRKIFPYLILCLFIQAINFIAKAIAGDNPSMSLLSMETAHWYAFALFVFLLVTIWIQKVNHKYVMIVSIMIACFVGYDKELGDFLVLSRLFAFYPFFFAGFCLDPGKLQQHFSSIWAKIAGWAILLAAAFSVWKWTDKVYWLRPMLTGRNPFSSLGDYADWGALIRFVYYPAVFILIFAVLGIAPNRRCILTYFGKRTLQIYSLHVPVMYLFYGFGGMDLLDRIWPAHSHLLLVVVAVINMAVTGLAIWDRPFRFLMNPPMEKKKEES